MKTSLRFRPFMLVMMLGLMGSLLATRAVAQDSAIDPKMLIGTWHLTTLDIHKTVDLTKPQPAPKGQGNGAKVKKVAGKAKSATYQFVDATTLVISKEDPNSSVTKKLTYKVEPGTNGQAVLVCTSPNGQKERTFNIVSVSATQLVLQKQKPDGSAEVLMTFTKQ